ncbi:MAG: hypothetical protein MJ209_04035 [archaeon]|nr:hypothetical protein [archaeon]
MEISELLEIMERKWDKEKYCDFIYERPTAASIEKYICMLGTRRFMIIAYTRKSGFLSKNAKVVLSIADNIDSIKTKVASSLARDNVFTLAYQIAESKSSNAERKGPTQDLLLEYTAHMKEILTEEGLL